MERTLVKTWIYSLLVALSLSVIFVRDSYRTDVTSSGYTTITLPLRQYILEILRGSLAVSLLVTVVVAVVLVSQLFGGKRQGH